MKKLLLFLTLAFFISLSLKAQIVIQDNDLEENISYTWTNDNEYLIDGFVFFKPGSILTIEAGTVIKGMSFPTGGDPTSILTIMKGATINALGEASCPIIFTSELDDLSNPTDLGIDDKGLWGGVILLGNGILATLDGTSIVDGTINSLFDYGGTDNAESSGTLRYVSIRHAGGEIGIGAEINGLTLAGIGSGTTIEYVETFACSDDGIEFLGGAVDAKYLTSLFNGDDAFDFDLGWQGKGQFWFGIAEDGGWGLEGDGAKPDLSGNPSNPILSNLTFIGNTLASNAEGIVLRDNSKGKFYNSIITSYGQSGFVIEELDPFTQSSFDNLLAGDITIANNIWFDFNIGNTYEDFIRVDGATGNEQADVIAHFNANNNEITDPQLTSVCYNDLTCINPLPQTGSLALSGAQTLTDPFFQNVNHRGAFGNSNWTQGWSILDPNLAGNNCTGIIEGKITIQIDENNDCLPDLGEQGLEDWIIEIQSPSLNYFVKTNDNGEYIGFIPNDATQAIIQPANYLWNVCTTNISLTNVGSAGATNAAFSVQAISECPLMTVDISSPFLRRCFDNTYTVKYCNQGTVVAEDVSIEVELGDLVDFISSPISSTINADGKYVFEVDDLDIGTCISFPILVNVNCDAVLGQTHCATAEVFPDTICSSALAAPLIELEVECLGSEVKFKATNASNIGMTQPANYIVTEDHVMMQAPNANFQLGANESQDFVFSTNGTTFHFQTIKHPGFAEFGVVTSGIEGCVADPNDPFSTGFLTGFSLSSGDQNTSIDCQENIGAFDPNDKTPYPAGIQEENYLRKNTDVEYRIRFQNSGTDTAFNIVVIDTISEFLDLNTLRVGVSSHDYEWSLDGRALSFNFNNIMLPDSNINEPASHGFIKFKISQIPDLADGTMIYNRADIYFDFNEPILTNEVFYTIGQPLPNDVLSIFDLKNFENKIKVFPNPFNEKTIIDLKEEKIRTGRLNIYNQLGQLVRSQNFQNHLIEVKKNELQAGVYFFEIQGENNWLGSGKLLIK